MAFDDHTFKWIVRETLGSSRVKNEKDVLHFVAGYTAYRAMPATASATAVLNAAATTGTGATTYTDGQLINPDVPRNLTMVGTAGLRGFAVITGTNVEGKVITSTFALNGATTVTGNLAFKTVTQVVIPAQTGNNLTVSIGTGNKLGLNHRLEPGQYGIRVVTDTTSAATSLDNQAFDGQPTVTTSDLIELNTATPVTTPNGATWFRIYYYIAIWRLNNQDANEEYSTTTSTSSTSSSTSTTTITTSTSSSSISTSSTSSTSSSTSSTSSSTSSTSSSTSTLP